MLFISIYYVNSKLNEKISAIQISKSHTFDISLPEAYNFLQILNFLGSNYKFLNSVTSNGNLWNLHENNSNYFYWDIFL